MASVTPPDMVLTLLEGITTIIHYCLLDPSTQYHQVKVSGCLRDSYAVYVKSRTVIILAGVKI